MYWISEIWSNSLLAEIVSTQEHLGGKNLQVDEFNGVFLCRFYLGRLIKHQRFLCLRLRLYDNHDIESLLFKNAW